MPLFSGNKLPVLSLGSHSSPPPGYIAELGLTVTPGNRLDTCPMSGQTKHPLSPASEKDMWPKWANETPGWDHGKTVSLVRLGRGREQCGAMPKWVKTLSRVRLFATPWTIAYQVPPSMGFSRQEYWSGLPSPSLGDLPDPGIEPRSPTL